MLGFLRDYLIYLWNVFFGQTQPVSGKITTTGSNASDKDKSTPSVNTQAPSAPGAPADNKEKVEEQKPQPRNVPTPTKSETSDTSVVCEKPPKPAELSYPSTPVTTQEKTTPPEPSKPPPSLSEPISIPKPVSSLETKPVSPPQAKSVPPLGIEVISSSEVKSIPLVEPKSLPEENKSQSPGKPAEKQGTFASELKTIPISSEPKPTQTDNTSTQLTVENKTTLPKEEVSNKPKSIQQVKQESSATEGSEDLEDEEIGYADEIEEEDIEEYDLDEKIKNHLRAVQQQQIKEQNTFNKSPKVDEYDSEEEIIQELEQLDDENSETDIVISK